MVAKTQIQMPMFDKLNGDNFAMWKLQMSAYLKVHGLMSIVDRSEKKPTEATTLAAWVTRDATAMLAILTAIDSSQLEYVSSAETSATMWGNLLAVYERVDPTSKVNALREYHRYAYDGSPMPKHLARVENLAQKCAAVGEEVSESNIIAKMIDNLPEKFNAVVEAWDVVREEDRTKDNLKRMLLRSEARMKGLVEAAEALAVEKKSAEKKRPPKKKFDKKNVECYNCHKKGHFARECRTKVKAKTTEEKQHKETSASQHKQSSGNQQKTSQSDVDNSANSCFSVYEENLVDPRCIADSGASRHIIVDISVFDKFESVDINLRLANNLNVQVKGIGEVPIERFVNGRWETGRLLNVFYVPALKKNLFSIGAADRMGVTATVKNGEMLFYKNGKLQLVAEKGANNLYYLKIRFSKVEANVVADLTLWHQRLCHMSITRMRELAETGTVSGLTVKPKDQLFCDACQLGKMHQKSFEDKTKTVYLPGDLFYSDVNGPMPKQSYGGHRYFAVFKDAATGFRYVFFLKHKNEVYDKFVLLSQKIKNLRGKPIKWLRTDNGLEYKNRRFEEFCSTEGIEQQFTAPYTPEQVGAAERENRTIVEHARTMLIGKGLEEELWAEATLCATNILNRAPTVKTPNSSPFEKWFGKKPELNHVRIFGSIAYEHVPDVQRTKWEPKAKKKLLVGYDSESNNYRLLDMKTKKISVSRNVSFDEVDSKSNIEPKKQTPIVVVESNKESDNEVSRMNEVGREDEAEIDVSQNENEPQEETGPQLRDRALLRQPDFYQACLVEMDEPCTYEEAMGRPDARRWKAAIDEELEVLKKMDTWEICNDPTGRRPIGAKLVFKIKRQPNGVIDKYKVRLVACGYTQRTGLDVFEVYAPVVRYDSIRGLLAEAAREDYVIGQFDIQAAFLNAELDEDVYMILPSGLPDDGRVVKLKRSLYGLRQAPRQWNRRFTNFLAKYDLKPSPADKCVFRGSIKGEIVLMALYVDDGLIFAKTNEIVEEVLKVLKSEFEITIGNGKYYVGLEIERNREKKLIKIHQRSYLLQLANRFNMSDAKAFYTPAEHSLHLEKSMSPKTREQRIQMKKVPYREAVGCLMFAACVTRPDIMYAVSMVSRYLENPGEKHWSAVKRIIRYAKETSDYGILYDGNNEDGLSIYTDSDYAADIDTRRSTSGCFGIYGGGPITWMSRRQRIVALSTTEAEFVAATDAVKEGLWLRRLFNSIGSNIIKPTPVYVDNQGAIKLIKNPEYHSRTKHIDVRYHFIRDVYKDGDIYVEYVPSSEQLADILTKALPKIAFERNRTGIQMIKDLSTFKTGGSVEK